MIASRIMPGGRPAPGPPAMTLAPALCEERGQAGAGGHGHHGPAVSVGHLGAGGGDLLGEVGDPDPVRPTGGDAGLDRGAHVVDVDVDVPQPLAADHHERVTQRRQRGAERGDRGRRGRRGGTSPRRPVRRR